MHGPTCIFWADLTPSLLQGLYHNGGPNARTFARYMIHMVYAPSWLRPTDRLRPGPAFLARTTPQRH